VGSNQLVPVDGRRLQPDLARLVGGEQNRAHHVVPPEEYPLLQQALALGRRRPPGTPAGELERAHPQLGMALWPPAAKVVRDEAPDVVVDSESAAGRTHHGEPAERHERVAGDGIAGKSASSTASSCSRPSTWTGFSTTSRRCQTRHA
jgi:hypothetical protein